MKKFLILGAFAMLALVSCKEKAAEAPVVEEAVEAAPVEAAPVDTTATAVDTTAAAQ